MYEGFGQQFLNFLKKKEKKYVLPHQLAITLTSSNLHSFTNLLAVEVAQKQLQLTLASFTLIIFNKKKFSNINQQITKSKLNTVYKKFDYFSLVLLLWWRKLCFLCPTGRRGMEHFL